MDLFYYNNCFVAVDDRKIQDSEIIVTEKGESFKMLAYQIGESLYLNITNRCSNRCYFCIRGSEKGIGYDLWLDKEPDVSEIVGEVGNPVRFREIVFCGYGEPLLRPEVVIETSKQLKSLQPLRIRINTNGQGNLINGRNIVPDLAPVIDSISISLNAENAEKYNKICCPDDPEHAYQAVLDFAEECKKYIPEVILSVVDVPDISVGACRDIADSLGMSQSAISHQLRMLKQQDLVKNRREGKTIYYSLADDYPVFHVTCITHRRNPVYFATVVGRPPMEDCYLAKATERIFLPLLQQMLPEIVDINMPMEGVFHDCVIVSIRKAFPMHARKVMHAFWGMGQMMNVKMIIVVDAHVDVQNLKEVWWRVYNNIDAKHDLEIVEGPLDVLDHSSPMAKWGAKLGIDATKTWPEEGHTREWPEEIEMTESVKKLVDEKWDSLGLD